MRYVALAVDFDGTIAKDGEVPEHVTDALHRVRESGRRTILVTGRELPELRETFAGIGVFDRVVAENGAVVFDPERRETRTLGEPPPSGFVETLKRRGVDPISVGSVIVATWEPHETTVLETIRDLGLGLQIVFNKGAVMALPSGVDKATGLAAALDDLGLSMHNVVGVGDAENDHAFLERCELSVAVGNALDALKERCDHVTEGERGDGVIELIEAILEDDLRSLDERVGRHDIPIGSVGEDRVTLRPYRSERARRRAVRQRQVDDGRGVRRGGAGAAVPVLPDRSRGRLRGARARDGARLPRSRADRSRGDRAVVRSRPERSS